MKTIRLFGKFKVLIIMAYKLIWYHERHFWPKLEAVLNSEPSDDE